jgi:hypothetical protein
MSATAQQRIYLKGRPTDGWRRGEQITQVTDVKEGDVLIGVSHQFQAENLYTVVHPPGFIRQPEVFHVQYTEPSGKLIGVYGDFLQSCAVHDFTLDGPSNAWFLGEREDP